MNQDNHKMRETEIRTVWITKDPDLKEMLELLSSEATVEEVEMPHELYLHVVASMTEQKAFVFAVKHSDLAVLMEPKDLRRLVKEVGHQIHRNYEDTPEERYEQSVEECRAHWQRRLCCRNYDLSNRTEYQSLNPARAVFSSNHLSDFSFLKQYSNTVSLMVADNPVEDLSMIADLKKLQFVSLVGTRIRSLDFVKDLPSLRELRLIGNPIEDYSPLFDCQCLEYLVIHSQEKEQIDVEKLKQKFPTLTVKIGLPRLFPIDHPIITVDEDLDSAISEAPYPVSLYEWVIQLEPETVSKEKLSIVRRQLMENGKFCSSCADIMNVLNGFELEVAEALLREKMTCRQVGQKFGIKMEDVIGIMKKVRTECSQKMFRFAAPQCKLYRNLRSEA